MAKLEYTLDIDFTLLKKQKTSLLSMFDIETIRSEQADTLKGMINLLDAIQDQAVDVHGIDEKEVFNLSDE